MLLLIAAVAATFLASSLPPVLGHGRLMDPPARNSMWRLGFANPVNYNDNELYCGGRVTQWARNKGKCGVCGDPHHLSKKDHEVGGKYANGIISREYVQGGVIDVTVHITANHKGYFEFRICPVEDPKVEVNQECLDKHVMKMANGEGSRYYLPEGKSNQFFNVSVRLPEDLTCSQCVIQWKYRTGNTWDKDDNGTFCVGCGPQEEFYNCADVAIHHTKGKLQTKQVHSGTQDKEGNIKGPGAAMSTKDDIFTKKKNNLESTLLEKISDYGKQKVNFIQKLENNKYSVWNEPRNAIKSANNGSPFAHLARKDSADYERRTSTDVKSAYADDVYNNQYQAMNTVPTPIKPSGVASQWKTGTLNNSNVDKIRRRFGYSSFLDNYKMGGYQKKTTKQLSIRNNGGIMKENLQNEAQQRMFYPHHKNYRQDNSGLSVSSKLTGSPRLSVPPKLIASPSQTGRSDVPMIPSGVSSTEIKAAKKLRDTLREIIHNKKANPRMQDNFLRRWKLSRLRHIAAVKALRAAEAKRNIDGQHLFKHHSDQSMALSVAGLRAYPNSSNTLSLSIFTPPSYEPKGVVYHRKHSLQSSVTLTPTESPRRQDQSSRKKYIRQQLPSWLVKALKMTLEKSGNGDHFAETDNNNEDGSVTLAASKYSDDAGSEYVQTPWGNSVSGFSNFLSLKADTGNKYITQHPDVTGYKIDRRRKQRNYDYSPVATPAALSGEKTIMSTMQMTDDEESDNISSKNGDEEDNEDTESLMKYIVSRLISRQKARGANKFTGTSDAKKKSTMKDATPAEYTWFVPAPIDTPESENMLLENRRKPEPINWYPEMQQSTFLKNHGDLPQQSMQQQENVPPSVRGEVRPFSGLILGSDHTYSLGLTKNVQQKYPAWKTTRPYSNTNIVNVKKTNQRSSQNHENSYRNVQRSSQQSNPNHENISKNQKLSLQTRERKPDYHKWFQENRPQKSQSQPQPQPQTLLDDYNDSHHAWSSRARGRQEHYSGKHGTTKSELVCESLVLLGGGMNLWCTNNCNANFCPSSMCLCRTKVPVYAGISRYPVLQSRVHPTQHNNVATSGISTEGINRHSGFNTGADSFITGDFSQNNQAVQSRYPTVNTKKAYIKPYSSQSFTQSPSTLEQYLLSLSGGQSKANVNLVSGNLIGSHSSSFREPTRIPLRMANMDMGGSNNNIHLYPRQATNNIGHYFDNSPLSGTGQHSMANQFRKYHKNQQSLQPPRIKATYVNSHFRKLQQTPKISYGLS